MQKKTAAAIDKYREAVTRPPTRNTYDRARWDAYWRLLPMLEQRRDFDGMEVLLKQRAAEYQGIGCFSVDYARFLVVQRADAATAQTVLREQPSPGCDPQRKHFVEGLVRYLAWAQSPEADRPDLLRQARVFQPVTPSLFYALASSDKGMLLARQLQAAGDKIGVQDERGHDALSIALQRGESTTAGRLLKMGANPLAEVGREKMPVALLPVIARDFEGIRLMQRAGVDYAKLRYRNVTAIDIARDQRDPELHRLLDPRSGKL